jgi:hypothetical protein
VPQIWLTYDELGALMDCDAVAARTIAHTLPLDRRRSHDGRSRAKLNAALTDIFIDRISRGRAAVDEMADATDTSVEQLRATHRRMSDFSARALPAPSLQWQSTAAD